MKRYEYKDYANYIEMQMAHNRTPERTRSKEGWRQEYISSIRRLFPETKSVLCIGSRDESEVLSFRNAGYSSMGIDLFSNNESTIRVLDMHKISEAYSKNEFDLAFSCHSLEHSYDPGLVIQSLSRVTRLGAFIVLPTMSNPDTKEACMFDFMSHLNSSPEVSEVLSELKTASTVDLRIKELKYRPNVHDGFWLSIEWIKDESTHQ